MEQSECQELIFNEIYKSIKVPNYYQIISVVDVLASQFKKFNRSYYINANLLNEFGVDKSIRTDVIESFIKITTYFTKGAFDEILETQEQTHILFQQYNSDIDVKNALEKLANNKHDVISFDKIDPSLLFFHEGSGEGFSIITNLDKDDDSRNERNNYFHC